MMDAQERARVLDETLAKLRTIDTEFGCGIRKPECREILEGLIAQVEAETLRKCHAELHGGMMCSCCMRVSDWCDERILERQQAQRAQRAKEGK